MGNRRFSLWVTIGPVFLILLSAGMLNAQTTGKGQTVKGQTPPVQILADRLETFNEKDMARFTGNVKATQQDTIVTCDRMDIFYTSTVPEKEKNPGTAGAGNIKSIIAEGDVRIHSQSRLAIADKAVYDAEKGTIVLTGNEARLSEDKNEITGSKITLFRDTNEVRVEGSPQKRVGATFYTGGQSIMK